MTKISRRHHYVPQFHTKHFSENENLINAFDKIENKFYPINPLNLFVERDRNTFENLEGKQDDVIERVYSTFDTACDKILKEITTKEEVSDANYKNLLLFAYLTKWRVPQYDQSFGIIKENYSAGELGLGIKLSDGSPFDFDIEELFTLDMQQELKRILLSIQPFRSKEDYKRLLNNSFMIPTIKYASFISDCPFIEATIDSGNLFEDFIFPITKNLTLVYSTRINRDEMIDFLVNGDAAKVDNFTRDFSSARDVSLLDLAERHVACGDENRLKIIVENYKQVKDKGRAKGFYMAWFNLLYNFKSYL